MVSRDLQERARAVKHHERKALQRIGEGKFCHLGPHTLAALVKAKWVIETPNASPSFKLTASGWEIHDALATLGWFPPDKKDVLPEGFSR